MYGSVVRGRWWTHLEDGTVHIWFPVHKSSHAHKVVGPNIGKPSKLYIRIKVKATFSGHLGSSCVNGTLKFFILPLQKITEMVPELEPSIIEQIRQLQAPS